MTMGAGTSRSDLAAVEDRIAAEVGHQPDHDTGRPLEQTAVADRVAVLAGAEPVDLHEPHAALRLAGHITRGDRGAVLRCVNELEHGLGPWDVSPWRLVEHLAGVLMRRGREQPGPESTPR
jgi:hypothetical protein